DGSRRRTGVPRPVGIYAAVDGGTRAGHQIYRHQGADRRIGNGIAADSVSRADDGRARANLISRYKPGTDCHNGEFPIADFLRLPSSGSPMGYRISSAYAVSFSLTLAGGPEVLMAQDH